MKTRTLFQLFLGLSCVILLSPSTWAAAPKTGNPGNPGAFNPPADFVPQAGDFAEGSAEGMFMGVAQLRGRVLKPRDGVSSIYLVRVPKGQPQADSYMLGDIIVAVNGNALKDEDPVGEFKKAFERAQNQGGKVAFTRWRKGTTQVVNLEFNGPQVPDLTKGGEPDLSQITWNLGTTGAAGWTWSIPHNTTEGSKQVYISKVNKGSAADGVLKVGDVVIGAFGANFTTDARKEFANALTLAETTEKGGKLLLTVWNDGKTREATVNLKVMGDYSDSTPNDDKSKRIIEDGVAHLLKKGLGGGIQGDVNALGLLATGREDVMPIVRAHAQKIAAEGKNLAFKQAMESWSWGYHNLLLTEYYLATKDESVLPAITEFSTMIAKGQSVNGNWGHSMCIPYWMTDGAIYGICPGYGALNQAGLPCMISMALSTKCGVNNEHITLALNRGGNFFRFYMDRGAVPYGDHEPGVSGHDDNGKSSLTAVMFDLMGDEQAAAYFTKSTIASYQEREGGHTGNYFNMLWGPLGAARGGDAAAAAFMKRIEWFFDLERRDDGSFFYQGKPGMAATRGAENQYVGWDCTGARLLAYCLPLKKLYITGKGRTLKDITGQELANAIDAGSLTAKQYNNLSTQELLAKLGSWSPAARHRAAEALGNKPDNVVPQLLAMLDSPNRYARYGACQGLREAGRQSPEAVDAIFSKGIKSSDQTMKFFAMRSFSSYDKEMGLATAGEKILPELLKVAASADPNDPDGRMKGEFAYYLFYSGNASKVKAVARKGEGVSKVDSDVLVTAVRDLLKVRNGGHRSTVTAVYDKLTEDQLKLLWKDIYQATRELAPADIMFADGVRNAGIQLMARHHAQEGLDTAVWIITNQKGHGIGDRTEFYLKMVTEYGGYAKAKIPELEKIADIFQNGTDKPVNRKADPKLAEMVRAAIKEIQAAPDPSWKMTSIAEYLK